MQDSCSMCNGEYCAVHLLEPCDCDTADRHGDEICGFNSVEPLIMLDLEQLGATLRRVRRERNMTQVDVARGANISSNYVSMMERSDRNISIHTLNIIGAALGVPAECLVMLSCQSKDETTLECKRLIKEAYDLEWDY